MLIPLSWLKELVEIKIPFAQLAEKLSAAGLTVEKWDEKDGDIIFDPEVTPNRPDWLSVYGVAREIAALTGAKLKNPTPNLQIKKPKTVLPLTIKPNYDLVSRKTSVIIRNVNVRPSPDWLQKRIKQIGLRPINNLVDITNYVLWLYGGLLHVFDYDKIRGHQMTIEQAKGGESFRSLDGIDYTLPKGAIIIKDVGRVIDLLPLKGGENTAASNSTKNVLLHSVVVDPVLTRRTSQSLGLRSDSSSVAEKGLDPNATITAVTHALSLILDLAGGEVASEVSDLKAQEFKPWTIEMRHQKMEDVLGIKLEPPKVIKIFTSLELIAKTSHSAGETTYQVTIPTFRNDLHIEEDLIEEVARIYGYNNFPKTLPKSSVPTNKVAYYRDFDLEYEIKQTLKGFGYSEIYSYSLISEDQLVKLGIDPAKTLRIDNPISRDYEYLRPHVLGNLLEALKLNLPNFANVKLFEFGKGYHGENIDKAKEETWISAIVSGEKFLECKGEIETLLQKYNVNYNFTSLEKPNPFLHPGRAAEIIVDRVVVGNLGEVHPNILNRFGIKDHATRWAINYDLLKDQLTQTRKYEPIPKYPFMVEDLSLIIPGDVSYGTVVATIQKTSHLIISVDLLDIHGDTKTLRLTYLDKTKNLTDKDIAEVRTKVLKNLGQIKVALKK